MPANADQTLLRVATLLALLAATAVSASDPADSQAGAHPWEAAAITAQPPFVDRAEWLLRQLSLEEKIGLMSTDSRGVNRSGTVLIPAFNWWQECLHGFNEQGERGATSFPQVPPQASGLHWLTGGPCSLMFSEKRALNAAGT